MAIDINVTGLGKVSGISGREETRIHTITLPVQLKRWGAKMRIILPGQKNSGKNQDDTLINLVAHALDWQMQRQVLGFETVQ